MCLRTYFVISRMCMHEISLRVGEILCTNAHETFACTNVHYRTEIPGQKQQDYIFQLDDLDL